MMLKWFNSREATTIGSALADQFAAKLLAAALGKNAELKKATAQQELFRCADQEVRSLGLNVYKRAKFANSFRWRLIEKGVPPELADAVTQSLILHLSLDRPNAAAIGSSSGAAKESSSSNNGEHLLLQGNKHFAQGSYAEAISCYQKLIALHPNRAEASNNLGAALCKVGRYNDAEEHFRQATVLNPDYPEAHNNLGNVLRWRGEIALSAISLRRALKLKPNYVDARSNLGLTLVLQGRSRDAKARFQKVLKTSPRHADALFGMGQVARTEGRFEEAETMFKRVLELKPNMPSAWAALAGIQKMSSLDGSSWLTTAEQIAGSGVGPLEEAELRFAIGKYYDDVEDFTRAFQSYQCGNALLKTVAHKYAPKERSDLVDNLMRVYTKETFANSKEAVSESVRPVFIVGMMRSGTSLADQIIASHPAAKGAGELEFWNDAMREHEIAIREGLLDAKTKKTLAEAYLRILADYSSDAKRVIDKMPGNSDYLGVIHSVFPKARVIYMRRNPIDTCLSAYFQRFSATLNFTMDLSDLADYYRQHQRLINHWRAVLPPGTVMEVPYEELVTDQEGWTRKMLDFLELEWDARCLQFHKTERAVVTASYWQVRQKIYKGSIERWRNYEKFIGPLLALKDS